MANQQIGNIHGVAARNAASGQQATNVNGSTTQTGGYNDADQQTIAAMRARLAAISGTTYTAQVLDQMTTNDMAYAIRLNDDAASI